GSSTSRTRAAARHSFDRREIQASVTCNPDKWGGRATLALIFLAFGVVDQTRAGTELAVNGTRLPCTAFREFPKTRDLGREDGPGLRESPVPSPRPLMRHTLAQIELRQFEITGAFLVAKAMAPPTSC